MKCPTKEQILEASKAGREVRTALEKLFPEVWERPVSPGQIYEWGTDSDGGSGLVVDAGSYYMFINFGNGQVYVPKLRTDTTNIQLEEILSTLHPAKLHDCYNGILRGPKHFRSWCTK